MVWSKANRGRYASTALAAARNPFVDGPSGDRERGKLIPDDKFQKKSYLFDRQERRMKSAINQEFEVKD